MKYLGSKNRIAKYILPIILAENEKFGYTTWIEPFVGGANMIDKVPDSFKRIGYDLNEHTIQALIGIRDYCNDLPIDVSETDYKNLKGGAPNYITSWIRFVCSWGGKFENGYARDKQSNPPRNYAAESKRNALQQSPKIQNIDFICKGYKELNFENCIIYCDPPYKNTTGYKTGTFDHDEFYQWCREQSKNNLVFVSEYSAPDDFKLVWNYDKINKLSKQRKTVDIHELTEKLYKV